MRMVNAMEEVDRYRVMAWWASARSGLAKSSCAPNAIHFSSSPAFGGMEGRWTPEELLLCSIASSYTTTFWALAECEAFEFTDLQVEAEGAITKTDEGHRIDEIFLRASLTIRRGGERERAYRLLHQSKELCLVGRALSINQKFEPRVEVGGPRFDVVHG